jgi:hypothetical protein
MHFILGGGVKGKSRGAASFVPCPEVWGGRML